MPNVFVMDIKDLNPVSGSTKDFMQDTRLNDSQFLKTGYWKAKCLTICASLYKCQMKVIP